MYIFFGSLSLFTVFLNLLVIVSISHFKQLHTPTNMLVLSLAVADFLIGLIVIPVEGIKLVQSCWYFGQWMCTAFKGMVYIIVFASLYNLVVIAVDRYIAVCDPLLYYSKITMAFLSWVLLINASINPLLYALFYPWFKTSVKYIITLRILAPESSHLNLTPDNC
ncbi:trace amine-associated receptor 6-like [Aplochiton taeniatus]